MVIKELEYHEKRDSMEDKLEVYLRENRDLQLESLKECLRIPSISTLSKHRGDVIRCATMVAHHLRQLGLENVELLETNGFPVVTETGFMLRESRRY